MVNPGSNSSGWAFGGGVPMGGSGLQNPNRQLGGNVSFAQSLSGSSPATPLDLSYVLSPSPIRYFFRFSLERRYPAWNWVSQPRRNLPTGQMERPEAQFCASKWLAEPMLLF